MSRPRAFTLTELLVVLLILALLAGILFPVFYRSRERAVQTTCITNLKILGTAFSVYAADYGGTFPCPGGKTTHIAWLMSTDRGLGKDAPMKGIWPYVRRRENGGPNNPYSCPLALPGTDHIYSPGQNYVMNDYLRPCHPGQDKVMKEAASACGGAYDSGINPLEMGVSPGQVILLYEAAQKATQLFVNRNGSPFFNGGVSATPPLCMGMPQSYHLGGHSCFLFCDGHVKAYVPGETWTPSEQGDFERMNYGADRNTACAVNETAIRNTGRYQGSGTNDLWNPHLPRVLCP